jgi:serine/threonine protein phosphatase PrpC
MRVESFGESRPQQGRADNEDAFLIGHDDPPFAALCDGAGNAQRAAKRVLLLFGALYKKATSQRIADNGTWADWIKVLDSSLLDGPQSTFVGVAVLEHMAVGACVGNSRAYLLDRNGECRILSEGAAHARLGSGNAEAFPVRQALKTGETLLLLSDGVWTPLTPSLLKKAVTSVEGSRFSAVPQAILDAASRAGRPDDMTAVALRLLP